MRVAILDDEPLFRHLLARSLRSAPDIRQVDEYGTSAELLDAVSASQPDAVIVDLVLSPGQSPTGAGGGLAAGLAVRERLPQCGVVILSNHASADVLSRVPLGDLSGWAYLLKRRTDDIADVVRAVHVTRAGDTMIDPAIVADAPSAPLSERGLSAHQERVLQLLAGGGSNAMIAAECGTTTKSVEHAITSILDVLEIDSRDRSVNARVVAATAYIRLIGNVG